MHLRELTNNLFKESKMADIFGTQSNKATQAVIDAASKIMMGVKDDETAKAQTEDQHPAIDPKYKEQEDVQEKMSSKEKMKKGLYSIIKKKQNKNLAKNHAKDPLLKSWIMQKPI